MSDTPILLTFEAGTIVLTDGPGEVLASLPGVRLDPRTNNHRAPAMHYRNIVEEIRARKLPYKDSARSYDLTPWTLRSQRKAFPHQAEAVETWWNTGGRGVVVLPTGTGKTFVAILTIQKVGRPALVVTPTIDLMHQWHAEISAAFETEVGLLGGGAHEIQPLTVTTYDSARTHMERYGNRFGVLIFDECHHLPGATTMNASIEAIAPYRMGLTATPERNDGQDTMLPMLIGPIVYRREIGELKGDFLAEYETRKIFVDLTEEEAMAYQQARDHYKGFCADRGFSMGGAQGWQRFIQETSRSKEGRAAFLAYQEQRKIALAAPAKLHQLEKLLMTHRKDRVLVFTYDNATAYEISRRYLVPVITHHTKAKERKAILEGFQTGEYSVIATSRVLNEGVDVPAANVGIVLSGTSTVTEHVQRLGRLLRKRGDKRALLIEVVTKGTVEEFITQRRTQHHAYQ
jgi:superfamily II DNA or RNA helicase